MAAEETAAKGVQKRYEGLVMVRTKAIKGKGAWYWSHLEPILIHNSDTNLPKAVKLKCGLCDSVFSASNPSRTASEHLKRGTCPNFNSFVSKPVSPSGSTPSPVVESPTPLSLASPQHRSGKKRNSCFSGRNSGGSGSRNNSSGFQVQPLAVVDASRFSVEVAYSPVASGGDAGVFGQHHQVPQQQQQHLVLSGGKDDLGALAMFEDSVKKLKSPKVSFSSLEHPKFKAFLNQVGLPSVSKRELAGERLDVKYNKAKAESEAKIQDAMFFQIASDGWKSKSFGHIGEENLVKVGLNLPNWTSVFRRAVFTSGYVPSKYAEEVLWEAVLDICGNNVQQCVGIVADRFKSKALKSLENQHHWMVNLTCQFQGFNSLIKDLIKELPLFKNVIENCSKLANFVNGKSQVRNTFHKFQLQEYGHAGLLRVPSRSNRLGFGPVYTMVEDILSSARALQLVLLDDSYKIVSMEEPLAQEIEEMMRNPHFWNELEAVHSLVKLIKGMAQEIEVERPRVGQCLPLWEDLRVKVRDWCSKFHITEAPVERVIERRFRKNYHPAWAAAFILDPLYLIRDASGKYLPPFKCLTPEQEKDVDKLITRLVSREEVHVALMELMKWRTEGLDPVYAQAVQIKQRDPTTGKMKIANPQSSRLVWETYLTEFKALGKVAVRLIFLHATSFGFKCNASFLRWISANTHSRAGMDRAQKLIFIAAHSKLERRDFSNEEEKDAEFLTVANGEDDALNEAFVDASCV
ncbi:Sterol-4alpha-methyl oxidase 1-1 [Heracleum sosnowskyi]|uniref:Sterol-4alpha-methyl oxidase 1-1 n=1 Tax=Heracleum sosnowskyi TaxID=360622 RepID=A0AAD8M230_9APIA|nr:Sterol-4alpha-methyl oxidase 1-1 [Heracleum sosnowskyi]